MIDPESGEHRHTVVTTHIRAMLEDALHKAKEGEYENDELDYEIVRATKATFLWGAALQARHAAAELEDELFRLMNPGIHLT